MSEPTVLTLNHGTTLQIYPDVDTLSVAAAMEFVRLARLAIQARGRFDVALAGGSTPRNVYQQLASAQAAALPWEQVHLFFGDERSVGPDDPQSNFRMVRESLLSNPAVRPITHRIASEQPAEAAASLYEVELQRHFNTQPGSHPQFDLILLGVGTDGHTASLFPNTTALAETVRAVVANNVPQLRTERITLTFPVLNQARQVLFLAAGTDKSSILEKVLRGTDGLDVYPAQKVKPMEGSLGWIVDAAAASGLR
jgi:6-phosphogluconolactonase